MGENGPSRYSSDVVGTYGKGLGRVVGEKRVECTGAACLDFFLGSFRNCFLGIFDWEEGGVIKRFGVVIGMIWDERRLKRCGCVA